MTGLRAARLNARHLNHLGESIQHTNPLAVKARVDHTIESSKLRFSLAEIALGTVESEEKTEPMRQHGVVKFFNQDKGYGFISPDDGGKDVFVHVTAVQQAGIPELSEGTKLSFDVQPDKRGRGPQAVDLQLT
jgi:cold shock protein